MDVERSLPLELEDHAAAVSCLLERFSREQDSVVRAKLASLLGQLGKSPLLKATDLADNIVRMLKTESRTSLCDYYTQWSNCGGTRGNGIGIPLPFLVGERRSPSLHNASYLQHKQQKKMCVKCMI